MSNTPKLTDEQREEIQKMLRESESNWTCIKHREHIRLLLSSEQARKSEAERLQREVEKFSNLSIHNHGLAAGYEQQRNQAIEVLKGIERNSLDGESRYRAHLFLSSLQEDKP